MSKPSPTPTFVPSPFHSISSFDQAHDTRCSSSAKDIFTWNDLMAFNRLEEQIVGTKEEKNRFRHQQYNSRMHPGFIEYLKKFSNQEFNETASQKLIDCAQHGDTNGVLNALKQNADINYKHANPYNFVGTALMVAADRGDTKLVEILLAVPGIDLNINSPSNALFLAAGKIGKDKFGKSGGKGKGHSDIVLKLLSIPNQDLNYQTIDYWQRLVSTRLLHGLVCQNDDRDESKSNSVGEDKDYLQSIQKLIQEGADVNFIEDEHETTRTSIMGKSPFTSGFSTLMFAAMHGKSETVKLLLTVPDVNVFHGKNCSVKKYNNQNAFFYAVESDSTETLESLLAHLATNCMSRSSNSIAVKKIQRDCLELPLIKASMMGHTTMVQLLLAFKPWWDIYRIMGVDINCFTDNGVTPLQNAVYYGHIETVQVILRDHRLVPMTNNGDTSCFLEMKAFELAKKQGHTEILEMLKNYQIKKNKETKQAKNEIL